MPARRSDGLTCRLGSKAEREETVSSPRRAREKNAVVRQAKIAASRGWDMSIFERMEEMSEIVTGERFGRLEQEGASLEAPSRAAFNSVSGILHSQPCSVCHARIAYR